MACKGQIWQRDKREDELPSTSMPQRLLPIHRHFSLAHDLELLRDLGELPASQHRGSSTRALLTSGETSSADISLTLYGVVMRRILSAASSPGENHLATRASNRG